MGSEVIHTEHLAGWTRDLPSLQTGWEKDESDPDIRVVELETLLNDIRVLHDWAIAIEEKAGQSGPTSRSERRERDYARDALLKALLRIWRDIFERPIRISTYPHSAPPDKRGRATGPLIQFLEVCLSFFDGFPDHTADGLRDHVTRLKRELTAKSGD